MAAKLKDIAARLNLSPATVSMILNNKGVRIPKETEDLVRRTAEELNYHPNRMAVSLVTKRTMNVALIVPDIQNSFFAELAKYVGDYLKTKQYNLILCSTNYDVQDDIRLLRMLRSRMVDGIIGVFTGEDLEYTREIERVLSDKIGIVMMDKVVSGVTTPYVGTDNFLGGRLAMEHLIENGHRRIAVVTGPMDSMTVAIEPRLQQPLRLYMTICLRAVAKSPRLLIFAPKPFPMTIWWTFKPKSTNRWKILLHTPKNTAIPSISTTCPKK